jgi:hypothetical protein
MHDSEFVGNLVETHDKHGTCTRAVEIRCSWVPVYVKIYSGFTRYTLNIDIQTPLIKAVQSC